MAIKIDKRALEEACKEIIETILFCLPDAYKGTVYRIGKPPQMIAKRITSGEIDAKRKVIAWGLPQRSDYNPPGKPWGEYRDELARPLEAMGWCVEKQSSWTAENPKKDRRSARLQAEGIWKDFYHMEPVLLRKADLYPGDRLRPEYPETFEGEILWRNSEFVVVAVIKIHFRPNTIKIGSLEARIIKRLSRALGTKLFSYQLKQQSVDAMRQLAEDRLSSCNILADSLRNAITKSGLIFSLIKLELGSLREKWEEVLLRNSDKNGIKREAVRALNKALGNIGGISDEEEALVDLQNKFLELFLPPEQGENWVRMQIEERWDELLNRLNLDEEQIREIRHSIEQLKKSLYLGKDPDILAGYDRMPESLKMEWVDLIYRNTDSLDLQFLERLINILEEPSLNLPHREKCRKSLIHLKNIAQVMDNLEESTNMVLRQVLNGQGDGAISNVLNSKII